MHGFFISILYYFKKCVQGFSSIDMLGFLLFNGGINFAVPIGVPGEKLRGV